MINQTGELIVYQIVLVPRYEDIYHSAGKCDCGPLYPFIIFLHYFHLDSSEVFQLAVLTTFLHQYAPALLYEIV